MKDSTKNKFRSILGQKGYTAARKFRQLVKIGYGNNWVNYKIDHTNITKRLVINFLSDFQITENTIIVVHKKHIRTIKKKTNGIVLATDNLREFHNIDNVDQCLWCTERVDYESIFLRRLISNNIPYHPIKHVGPARSWHHNPIAEETLLEEFQLQNNEGINRFGYGTGADFGNLIQFIDNAKNLPGDFVEVGPNMGSSSCVMIRYMQKMKIYKTFRFYDVFGGFNYDEAKKSLDNTWVGRIPTDGKENVEKRIKSRASKDHQIEVYIRNVCEPDPLRECEKIAFINIDVDLYEAVLAALIAADEKIVPHGIIVVEDAGHTPWLIGANAALFNFLHSDNKNNEYHILHFESGQKILIRIS